MGQSRLSEKKAVQCRFFFVFVSLWELGIVCISEAFAKQMDKQSQTNKAKSIGCASPLETSDDRQWGNNETSCTIEDIANRWKLWKKGRLLNNK